MSSIATTQVAVLNAFITKLQTSALFNATNCWLSDDPAFEIPSGSRHHLYAIVYPTDGAPNEGEFDGGGDGNLIEYTGATVVIYSALRLQQAGKPGIVLTHATYGLYVIKRALLKLLHGKQLTDGGGNSLLTQHMEYIHGERPTIQGQPVGDLALTFNLPFQWDLET